MKVNRPQGSADQEPAPPALMNRRARRQQARAMVSRGGTRRQAQEGEGVPRVTRAVLAAQRKGIEQMLKPRSVVPTESVPAPQAPAGPSLPKPDRSSPLTLARRRLALPGRKGLALPGRGER